jgi:hypothetical protein
MRKLAHVGPRIWWHCDILCLGLGWVRRGVGGTSVVGRASGAERWEDSGMFGDGGLWGGKPGYTTV